MLFLVAARGPRYKAGMTDDLFATPEPPKAEARIFSVTEVTRGVKGVIESAFGEMWVEGEVSNHRLQASGHQYFTLKDAGSQLSCVMFARGGSLRRVAMQDGMLVQAKGKLTVYEARGQYQMVVSLLQPAGAGLLQAKFEALKRKLALQGLFDEDRKRALPEFPRAVGIITSPTGAALRDMLNILARRAPWLRVIVSPVRVQGDGAAAEMIAALAEMNAIAERGIAPVDVIVLARGGGSIEDLWEFNDERLAHAIAASALPVVSAVGHEIDFTIADFVADLRAPTPSAAAELIAPDAAELLRLLDQRAAFLHRTVAAAMEAARRQLLSLARSALFREPQQRVQQAMQQADLAQQSLQHALDSRLAEMRQTLARAESRLRQHRPDQQLALHRQRLDFLTAALTERVRAKKQRLSEKLARVEAILRLLSPVQTLQRGYSLTTTATGKLLRKQTDAHPGETLITRLPDGEVRSLVQEFTAVKKGRKPKSQK